MAGGDSKEEQARRLRAARERAGFRTAIDGWKAAKAAGRADVSQHTYYQHENGTRSLQGSAEQYAMAFGVPAAWLVWGVDAPEWAESGRRSPLPSEVQGILLPVVGDVQAGAWLPIDEFDQREPQMSTSARDPDFPGARQWIRRVRGDSVNKLGIVDGDLVHCVDIDEAHYQINTGDVVEVERTRFQGAEVEHSIKEVEITSDGKILLWPRSTNPRWSKPLDIMEGSRGEDETVQVRGLVLNVIKPRKRLR